MAHKKLSVIDLQEMKELAEAEVSEVGQDQSVTCNERR